MEHFMVGRIPLTLSLTFSFEQNFVYWKGYPQNHWFHRRKSLLCICHPRHCSRYPLLAVQRGWGSGKRSGQPIQRESSGLKEYTLLRHGASSCSRHWSRCSDSLSIPATLAHYSRSRPGSGHSTASCMDLPKSSSRYCGNSQFWSIYLAFQSTLCYDCLCDILLISKYCIPQERL